PPARSRAAGKVRGICCGTTGEPFRRRFSPAIHRLQSWYRMIREAIAVRSPAGRVGQRAIPSTNRRLFATRFGLLSRSPNVKTITEKFEDTPSLSGSESVSGEHSVLSKKSESGLRRYFYDTLASYLSLYIRPKDRVVEIEP